MQIHMTIRHGVGGANLRTYLEEGMDKALGRFREWVNRVDLRLEDVNGPRGGQDKRCWIQVDLDGRGPVHVTAFGDSPRSASSLAIQKLKARLRRVLDSRGKR